MATAQAPYALTPGISQTFRRLKEAGEIPVGSPHGDANLSLLLDRLQRGCRPVGASLFEEGLGPWPGPCLLVVLDTDGHREEVPVCIGPRSAALLPTRLAGLPLSEHLPPRSEEERGSSSGMRDELGRLFEETAALEPEERAATLMEWIMERIQASRCALVPFESGAPGEPVAFRLRGKGRAVLDARHIPRQVLFHVARARQPLVSDDVRDPDNVLPPAATVLEQKVRSYMAVPVVFRGELLAVCYVDRFESPRDFGTEERAAFEAFAYELASPLLALRDRRRRREYRELRDARLAGGGGGSELVTSPALEPVLEKARRLAPYPEENLLVLGETGVGKEVIARFVHRVSDRPAAAFVAVNIAALSDELFESELMGSVKGAFTGAVDRPGRVAEAEGGTLFLDEIGELTLANQVKLLRFLQDKKVRRVGGETTREADVRIIAATNRDLDEMMAAGDFRRDLFHRFAPALRVPPLRERPEEILTHAEAWISTRSRSHGIAEPSLSDGARRLLEEYAWPGNVRQLEMVLSHALLLAEEEIDRDLLQTLLEPAAIPPGDGPRERPADWEAFCAWRDAREKEWLAEALAAHEGNVEGTAREIGCPPTTLRRLLQKHGLL